MLVSAHFVAFCYTLLQKLREIKHSFKIERQRKVEICKNFEYVANRATSENFSTISLQKCYTSDMVKRHAPEFVGLAQMTPEQAIQAKRAYNRRLHVENLEAYRARNRLNARLRHLNGERPTRPESPICEVCGAFSTKRSLHLDHDHKTGAFRGWLCGDCNNALGSVRDDPAILRLLADYLEAGGPPWLKRL